MTTTAVKRLEIEALMFVLLGAAVGMVLLIGRNQQQQETFTIPVQAESPTATPTQTPFEPEISTSSQISPDGTRKVTITKTQNEDGTYVYAVSTQDDGTVIFSKTLAPQYSLSIPFNTWEPTNRYFFIQENTPDGERILVFQADGKPLDGDVPYVELTEKFANLNTGLTFDEATGWAGYNLIVFNTFRSDGTKGPSYWFELPSQAIYPLATQF